MRPFADTRDWLTYTGTAYFPDVLHRLVEVFTGTHVASQAQDTFGRLLAGGLTGDLNGDPYRASDWGYALVRTLGPYGLGEVPLWVPAAGCLTSGLFVAMQALLDMFGPA